MTRQKTTLRQKIFLIVLGFAGTFLILEIVFRLGGFISLSMRDVQNQRGQKGNEVKILCLGESTTYMGGQDSYPRQLEGLLNEKSPSQTFKVFNKGVPSIHTTGILSQLEGHLKQVRPDMVIVMMGVNDDESTKPYEDTFATRLSLFFKNIRVIKFIKLSFLHTCHKIREIKAQRSCLSSDNEKKAASAYEIYMREMMIKNPKESWPYQELGKYYEQRDDLSGAEKVYRQAMYATPKNDFAYVALGNCLVKQNKVEEARKIFDRAIKINSRKDWAYRIAGEFYGKCNDFEAADVLFEKAVTLSRSDHDRYYVYLAFGRMYLANKKIPKALSIFKKARQLKGVDYEVYELMAECYRILKEPETIDRIFSEAITNNAKNVGMVMDWYFKHNDFQRAEGILLQMLEKDLDDEGVKKEAAKFYRRWGMDDIARRFSQSEEDKPQDAVHTATAHNYLALADILNEKNIPLVVVSYPTRDAAPLKEILKDKNVFAYVDNSSFKDGVLKMGYHTYFTDQFAGDFGHCTSYGNRVLAMNILKVILPKVNPDFAIGIVE